MYVCTLLVVNFVTGGAGLEVVVELVSLVAIRAHLAGEFFPGTSEAEFEVLGDFSLFVVLVPDQFLVSLPLLLLQGQTSALVAVTATSLGSASRAETVSEALVATAIVLHAGLAVVNHTAVPVMVVALVLPDRGPIGLNHFLNLEQVLNPWCLLVEPELQHGRLEDLVQEMSRAEYERLLQGSLFARVLLATIFAHNSTILTQKALLAVLQ